MKFKIGRETLQESMGYILRVLPARPALEILSTVYLRASVGSPLMLAGSNLEVFITDCIPAEIEESGIVCLHGRTLSDLVNTLPKDATIAFAAADGKCKLTWKDIKNKNHQATLNTSPADEFPLIPDTPADGITLPIDEFHRMSKRVYIAAATDDTRPILTGVFTSIDKGKLTFAAADGFRLSVDAKDTSVSLAGTAVVPATTFQHLDALLRRKRGSKDEYYDELQIALRKGQVFFILDPGTVVVSQVIEGNFVNYGQIIPKEWATRATFDVKTMIDALKTGGIFARNAANLIHFRFDDGQAKMWCEAAADGSYEGTIDAELAGDPLEDIGFNYRLFMDGLQACPTPRCVFEGQSNMRPGVLKAEGTDEWVYVMMPMMVRPGYGQKTES